MESMERYQALKYEQHLNIRSCESGMAQIQLTGGVTEVHAIEQHRVTEESVAAVVIQRQ